MVKAMILNCLGFLRAPSYLFHQFFVGKVTEHLIRRGVLAEHEKLATVFSQPIRFESRRRSIQRFLFLPQLTIQYLWFALIKKWIKNRQKTTEKRLIFAIDRTLRAFTKSIRN